MGDYLNPVDPDRAPQMLEALGIEVVGETGNELMALCPLHEERTGKADHSPSWSFNIESGVHLCFSCGYRGTATQLVVDVLGLTNKWGVADYTSAEKWMQEFELDLTARVRKMERPFQAPSAKPQAMTDARLAVYTDPPDWALQARRLTLEACLKYGVRWDSDEDCWITPLRDPDTLKLMGFQVKGQGHRLFRNRPTGMKKSTTLFGIDVFSGGRIIVVESPLDAVRFQSAGVEGAVATCGALISERQMGLMTRADSIVLALDNPSEDAAGAKALVQFYELARDRRIPFLQFSYAGTDAKDPGDMDDDQIHRGLKNAKHSIYGLDALMEA